MKTLLIVPEFGSHGGGINTFYRSLLAHWAREHECHVLIGAGMVSEKKEILSITTDGVICHTLGIDRLTHWKRRFSRYSHFPVLQSHLAASWALKEMAEEIQPDFVEVCDFGLLFAAWVADPSIPFIVQLHGSSGQISEKDPMLGQELESQLLRMMESFATEHIPFAQTSSFMNAHAWAAASGLLASHMLPVWDLSELPTPSSARDVSLADALSGPVYRIFGRLQRWKGAEVVAQALALMPSGTVTVEWFGRDTPFGSPHQSTSNYLYESYPTVWGDSFRFKDQVTQSVVYQLQSTALCNIIPSTWDVFNFTVIEAMASGRPVVCSRGAGASELIEDGITGLLFEPGDANGLAHALLRIQRMSETERLQMADSAREVVLSRLSVGSNAHSRLAVYQSVISQWHTVNRTLPRWLAEALSPSTGPEIAPWSVLDRLPLKGLLIYVWQRIIFRFSWRSRP